MTSRPTASKIERIPIKLPNGFDPSKHQAALLSKVSESHGPGWEIESYDPAEGYAHLTRQAAVTEVTKSSTSEDSLKVTLARGTKVADGDKQAARFEDRYAEMRNERGALYMTKFEPFLNFAILSRLSDDEARCRGALAVALGVKPWDVQVKSRPDGGFDVELPKSYQPSKADKIQEVAEQVVGREGWYTKIDAQRLTASLIPSDPPTFPDVVPTPLTRLGKGSVLSTPFGMVLPEPGEDVGREARIDWKASAHALLAGMAGAGKSVLIQALLADRLANGAGLAVIDDASKAVDFLPFKDRCAIKATGKGPSGRDLIPTWGCDSLGGSVAVLAMLLEEGERRAKILGEKGLVNYLDMPDRDRFQTIFVVCDEFEALVAKEPVPKSLPKEHPMRMEAEQANIAHDMIAHFVNRIIKEMRFVGLSVLIASQISNSNAGLPPSIKSKMGHFILAGSNPSEAARRQTFSDERAVPKVPANVASGGMVAKGTGSAQIEGAGTFVFKSYFAKVEAYTEAFDRLGLPKYRKDQVTPTTAMIDRYLPRLDDEDDAPRGAGPREGERAPSGRSAAEVAASMGDEYGVALQTGALGSGFEKANAARHAAKVGSKPAAKPRTPDQNNPFASVTSDDDW